MFTRYLFYTPEFFTFKSVILLYLTVIKKILLIYSKHGVTKVTSTYVLYTLHVIKFLFLFYTLVLG